MFRPRSIIPTTFSSPACSRPRRWCFPDKPPVVTVPETAVDYTLYGDAVFLITEKKADDGKTSLVVVRTFVVTGNRVNGRVEILSGVKPGDRVVSVGQIKLQSGAAVSISADPAPPIPANPPRY
jgi:multidrug efflux system membrane fusion protein